MWIWKPGMWGSMVNMGTWGHGTEGHGGQGNVETRGRMGTGRHGGHVQVEDTKVWDVGYIVYGETWGLGA